MLRQRPSGAGRAPQPDPISRQRGPRPGCAAHQGSRASAAAQGTACPHGDPAPGLRLFIDSADVQVWRRYAPTGALWGATTNPAILEKDRVPCTLHAAAGLAEEAQALGFKELQLQAWGSTGDALAGRGHELLALRREHCPDVTLTIKLPCTVEGLAAAAQLRSERPSASLTVTGVYAAHQVLLARSVDADYVAPYLGRMGDALGAEEALREVAAMQAALGATTGVGRPVTRLLVASIRSAALMAKLAAQGCDTFTFAPAIMAEMLAVPATLAAVADFEAAAARNLNGA